MKQSFVCEGLIPTFQGKHNVEKVHVNILTDGEAQWSRQWVIRNYNNEDVPLLSVLRDQVTLRCKKTGRTYAPGYNGITAQLLRYMKGRFPQCNFLGFRIGPARDLTNLLQYSDLSADDQRKNKKVFNRDKCVAMKINGYQGVVFHQR